MDDWVRHWSERIAVAGSCLVILGGLALRVSPVTIVIRASAVGLILYCAAFILGGLVGRALLRLAVEDQLRHEEEKKRMRTAALEVEEADGLGELPVSEDAPVEGVVIEDVPEVHAAGREAA